jgi:hypothetical protein
MRAQPATWAGPGTPSRASRRGWPSPRAGSTSPSTRPARLGSRELPDDRDHRGRARPGLVFGELARQLSWTIGRVTGTRSKWCSRTAARRTVVNLRRTPHTRTPVRP